MNFILEFFQKNLTKQFDHSTTRQKRKEFSHIMMYQSYTCIFEEEFLDKADWSIYDREVIKSSHRLPVMVIDNIVKIFASFFMWQTEAVVLFEQCAVDCYYCGLLFGSFFGKMRSSAASFSLNTVYQIWLLGAVKPCQNGSLNSWISNDFHSCDCGF
mgnify:CR=1 FL=1